MLDPKLLLTSLALLGLGCQTVLTDIGSEVGDDTSSSEEEGSASEEEGEGDTQDEQEPQLVAARGIGIVEIEANQGVQVPLTAGTDWLGPAQRNARLVDGRETLIRVHWELAEGWEPHPVTFRLRLGELTLEQELIVDASSDRGSLDQTANWLLPAEESVAGVDFEVELLELDSDQDAALDELGSAAPSSGPELLGYEEGVMELEVVFVPIRYTGEGLDTLPELDDEDLAPLIDKIYEMNPVNQVNWSVREPYEFSSNLSSLAELFGPLSNLRAQDGAGPQVYYHAFIDPGCVSPNCTVEGTAGMALIANDSMGAPRVSVGTFFDVESVVDITVRELAYVQGLLRAPCPSFDTGGIDPDYPYPEGSIGVWGYGLRSGQLYDPASSYSFMSYCPDTWVSDWEWNKLSERIGLLSAW